MRRTDIAAFFQLVLCKGLHTLGIAEAFRDHAHMARA